MDSENQRAQTTAPWLRIPSRAISVVEHPCLVKNIDKGIASLGGPVKLSKGLRAKLELQTNPEGQDELPKIISVSLRPDDPFAKRLLSTPVTTNNLLLKVTVPKRTGRKRKRGSSGPFVADSDGQGTSDGPKSPGKQSVRVDAATIFRSLQDNASKYRVSVAGLIDETHRFRTLPDIQYAASTNSIMINLRDSVMPLSLSKLKKYPLNTASGADLTKDVGPSAEFLQQPVAYNYRFQQNAFVKHTEERGEVNLQRSLAFAGYIIIKPDTEDAPTGPKPNLPLETDLSPYLQSLIRNIRAELAKRPVITRHLLYNRLGWDKRDKLRQAAVYCGYFFETGPWREALIAWGFDPRQDPKYRFYQTVSFLSYNKMGTARHFTHFDQHLKDRAQTDPQALRDQHLFDGARVSKTGNLFQFCDITDPMIRGILQTKDIRTTAAPTAQGWYHVGTWAKATVILKHKMNTILGGEPPDNSIYQRILAWPELWDDKDIFTQYHEEFHDRAVAKERAKEHEVMRSVRWAARNPRYAFEQMEAARMQARGTAPNTMDDDEVEVPEDLTEVPDTAEDILNEGNNDGDVDSEEELEGEREPEEDEYDERDDEEEDGEYELEDARHIFGGLLRK